MDRVTDLPYIEQVHVTVHNVPGTALISLTLHHIMKDADRDRVLRTIELLLPSVVRLAVEL